MRGPPVRKLKLYRGVWCVVWRDPVSGTGRTQTKRASLRTANREAAERNYAEWLRQVHETADKINDILDLWLAEKQNLASIGRAPSKLKPIRAFFGHYIPEHVTVELCRKYAKTRKGLTNTTIRNELSLLRAALNWHNPKNKAIFELPPPDAPKDHFLTQPEYNSLYFASGDSHIRLFVLLGFHTGARSNAILELQWGQIDMQRRVINFMKGDHKNKRRSIVPVNDVLYEALKAACTVRTCSYVIEHNGRGVKSVKRGFGNAARKAGVQATPHILRHTAAVALAEGGVSMQDIAQYLGHAGKSTTERIYARFSPDYLRKAAKVLNDWHLQAVGSV